MNVNNTFVEPVYQETQYDMAITLIFSCLLAICLSIFNCFSAVIAVFFTLLRYKVSNNYLTFFFNTPNCFLKGIGHGINTADNLANMTKGTASDASRDANCNNLNKILCNSSELSLVAAIKNIVISALVAPSFFNGKYSCAMCRSSPSNIITVKLSNCHSILSHCHR